MTYKKLKDFKTFLIELFSNPKMREAVPGSASVSSDPCVFSIGEHMENSVVNPTTADIGKIRQDMKPMQVRFNKISSADFRSKSNKPWKPDVTPPRRREGFSRVKGGRQFDNVQQNDRSKNNDNIGSQNRSNVREMGVVPLKIEGKAEEILEVHSMVKVEDEVGLIKARMLDAQE